MNISMPSDGVSLVARRPGKGVLVVLVVYRRGLEAVPAWRQLQDWIAESPSTSDMHIAHVLIYDNSPFPEAVLPPSVAGVTVVHDAANGGTRAAYARALKLATTQELDWLLLLDHDTRMPCDFLSRLDRAMQRAAGPAPAAWLPQIFSHGRPISPAFMKDSGVVLPMLIGSGTPGSALPKGRLLTGIASGSVVAVGPMASVPAPPSTMWLDGIDHWYFLQLQHRGHSIACFDAVLAHELSVMDYAGLSTARASSILAANRALLSALPWQASVTYPARVLWFVLKLGRSNPGAVRTLFGRFVRRALGRA